MLRWICCWFGVQSPLPRDPSFLSPHAVRINPCYPRGSQPNSTRAAHPLMHPFEKNHREIKRAQNGGGVGMMGSGWKIRRRPIVEKRDSGDLEGIMTSIKSCKTLKHSGVGGGTSQRAIFVELPWCHILLNSCENIHLQSRGNLCEAIICAHRSHVHFDQFFQWLVVELPQGLWQLINESEVISSYAPIKTHTHSQNVFLLP